MFDFSSASQDAFRAMMMAEQNEPGTKVALMDRRLLRGETLTLTYRWTIEDQQRQLIIEGVQDVEMCQKLALIWWQWIDNRFNDKTYNTMTFTLPHHSIQRNVSDVWKGAHDSEYRAKADICYDGRFDVIQLTVSK